MKRFRRPKRQASAMGGVVFFIPILGERSDQLLAVCRGVFQDKFEKGTRVFERGRQLLKGSCHGTRRGGRGCRARKLRWQNGRRVENKLVDARIVERQGAAH